MRSVKDILQEKGSQVYSITPEATIYEALEVMADKNVGALPVMAGDAIAGIISERDYARKVVLKGRFSKETAVRAVMTTDIICIDPDVDVEKCMQLMTHNRVRHLPVLENGRVIGIISIGDIVKAIIEHKEEIIGQLKDYITGKR